MWKNKRHFSWTRNYKESLKSERNVRVPGCLTWLSIRLDLSSDLNHRVVRSSPYVGLPSVCGAYFKKESEKLCNVRMKDEATDHIVQDEGVAPKADTKGRYARDWKELGQCL